MNYIEKFKQVEKELDVILNKLESGTSLEYKKLLFSKSMLLLKKYSLINRAFDSELVNFLEDFKSTKIKSSILIVLNIICLFTNINMLILILITIMCSGYSIYFLRDMYKQKSIIDETILFNQNQFVNVLSKVEACEKYMMNNDKISIVFEDYDYAINFIMDYVISNKNNINNISDSVRDLSIKILKYDLKTNENDLNKLLLMYKEQYMLDNDIKKLIKK